MVPLKHSQVKFSVFRIIFAVLLTDVNIRSVKADADFCWGGYDYAFGACRRSFCKPNSNGSYSRDCNSRCHGMALQCGESEDSHGGESGPGAKPSEHVSIY